MLDHLKGLDTPPAPIMIASAVVAALRSLAEEYATDDKGAWPGTAVSAGQVALTRYVGFHLARHVFTDPSVQPDASMLIEALEGLAKLHAKMCWIDEDDAQAAREFGQAIADAGYDLSEIIAEGLE